MAFLQRNNLLKNVVNKVAKYAVEPPNCAKCIPPFSFFVSFVVENLEFCDFSMSLLTNLL